MSIGFVQAELKLCFCVRIGLFKEISLEASGGQHGRLSFGSRHGKLIELGEEESLVSFHL